MSYVKHPYPKKSSLNKALNYVGEKWVLVIVEALRDGPLRFVEIQRQLKGISTEQLRSRLASMVKDGLLTRERFREVPPRVTYTLTDAGHALGRVNDALAEWYEEDYKKR